MDQIKLFLNFTEPLEKVEIPYVATGSVAAMLYGIPRFTHDLDLVLNLHGHHARLIEEAFPSAYFYCPPFEVIQMEARRSQRGHFNLIHHESGLKADMYLFGRDDLHRWAFLHKRRMQLTESSGLWLAPPEYVILRKLQYYREGKSEKHLQDIRGILEVSGDLLDRPALNDWVESLRLENEFKLL